MKVNFKSSKNKVMLLISILVIVLAGLVPSLLTTPASAATTYIYATFKGDAAADEKLWIYTSSNGTSFNWLYNGFGGPTGVLRDPSLMKHSDGKYYIAFTVQSWTTNSTYFAIASSPNLTTWTNVTTVNSGIANTKFTWAPEWFIDGGTVKIICSIGTTAGGDFKPYVYTAQNAALTSWSGPTAMGIGANTIDTFVIKSGSTYHAFVKDENTKYIKHATSSSLTSGWSSFTNLFTSGYEGPSVIQLDDGTFRIYIDKYTAGGIWTATSSNLSSWSGLSLMGAYRHGTVLKDANYSGGPTPTPGTYYRITNRNSGKLMDVQNPNLNDGAKVGQYTANGGLWQKWQFVDAGSGYFNIISQNSGKCLDVISVSTADGAGIDQWSCNGGQNQQFQWVATGSYFNIKARHSGKCVNVVGSSTADGALLEQRTCGTGNSFQWTRQ
jgi:hypothetical protein